MSRDGSLDNWRDVSLNLEQSPRKVKYSRSNVRNVKFAQKLVRMEKSPKKKKRARKILVKRSLKPYETEGRIRGVNHPLAKQCTEVYEKYEIECALYSLPTLELGLNSKTRNQARQRERKAYQEILDLKKHNRRLKLEAKRNLVVETSPKQHI